MALQSVIDTWPGWFSPVENDGDGVAGNKSGTTSPSMAPSQPVTAAKAARPSKEKRSRPRELTTALYFWMERRHHNVPYASLDEKKSVAAALGISTAQVTNFCNNYRKRYIVKSGAHQPTSYIALVSQHQQQ